MRPKRDPAEVKAGFKRCASRVHSEKAMIELHVTKMAACSDQLDAKMDEIDAVLEKVPELEGKLAALRCELDEARN